MHLTVDYSKQGYKQMTRTTTSSRVTVMVGVMTAMGARKVKLVTDLPTTKQWDAIVHWFKGSSAWGTITQDDTQLGFAEVSTITLYIYR